MAIGDRWDVFDGKHLAWRPAVIANEIGDKVELQFQDIARPGLASTVSTTKAAMRDQELFRPRSNPVKLNPLWS
jgi:hypothetical protein